MAAAVVLHVPFRFARMVAVHALQLHNAQLRVDFVRRRGQGRRTRFQGQYLHRATVRQHPSDVLLPPARLEGRFPSQIEGVAVDVGDAERSGFIFRTSPSEINRRSPGLYQLLESRPARVDFKSPTDVFRITGEGIEFVDMETNTLDREKSDAFTRAMRDEGFAFPARVVAGNASTRKEYDNGYFIADNEFKVYHLKQVRGRPFVRRTDISPRWRSVVFSLRSLPIAGCSIFWSTRTIVSMPSKPGTIRCTNCPWGRSIPRRRG